MTSLNGLQKNKLIGGSKTYSDDPILSIPSELNDAITRIKNIGDPEMKSGDIETMELKLLSQLLNSMLKEMSEEIVFNNTMPSVSMEDIIKYAEKNKKLGLQTGLFIKLNDVREIQGSDSPSVFYKIKNMFKKYKTYINQLENTKGSETIEIKKEETSEDLNILGSMEIDNIFEQSLWEYYTVSHPEMHLTVPLKYLKSDYYPPKLSFTELHNTESYKNNIQHFLVYYILCLQYDSNKSFAIETLGLDDEIFFELKSHPEIRKLFTTYSANINYITKILHILFQMGIQSNLLHSKEYIKPDQKSWEEFLIEKKKEIDVQWHDIIDFIKTFNLRYQSCVSKTVSNIIIEIDKTIRDSSYNPPMEFYRRYDKIPIIDLFITREIVEQIDPKNFNFYYFKLYLGLLNLYSLIEDYYSIYQQIYTGGYTYEKFILHTMLDICGRINYHLPHIELVVLNSINMHHIVSKIQSDLKQEFDIVVCIKKKDKPILYLLDIYEVKSSYFGALDDYYGNKRGILYLLSQMETIVAPIPLEINKNKFLINREFTQYYKLINENIDLRYCVCNPENEFDFFNQGTINELANNIAKMKGKDIEVIKQIIIKKLDQLFKIHNIFKLDPYQIYLFYPPILPISELHEEQIVDGELIIPDNYKPYFTLSGGKSTNKRYKIKYPKIQYNFL